jgi:hypothetical protein
MKAVMFDCSTLSGDGVQIGADIVNEERAAAGCLPSAVSRSYLLPAIGNA